MSNFQIYDNTHDTRIGLGMLLCAMADEICTDLARGIRTGHLTQCLTVIPQDRTEGTAAGDAASAADFVKSKGCRKLCEWISEITGRVIEPGALVRESVKRAGRVGHYRKKGGAGFQVCEQCHKTHRATQFANCWRCRGVASSGQSVLQTHISI